MAAPPTATSATVKGEEYIALYSTDGHELILSARFCRHSSVLLNMVSPPFYGLPRPDFTEEPCRVKTIFQSRTLDQVCRYLLFKTQCMENYLVGDFYLEPEMALITLEAACFFEI